MNILIINGPNLDLLGPNAREIYGERSFDEFLIDLQNRFPDHTIDCFNSNVEGEIINKLHGVKYEYDGIIINPSSYAHYSIAMADTIAAVNKPVVEVHIVNLFKQDEDHRHSVTAKHCEGVIAGFGFEAYRLGIEFFVGR